MSKNIFIPAIAASQHSVKLIELSATKYQQSQVWA